MLCSPFFCAGSFFVKIIMNHILTKSKLCNIIIRAAKITVSKQTKEWINGGEEKLIIHISGIGDKPRYLYISP